MGVPPPKNLAAQKHQNFGIRDSIANISGREQDIVYLKTALETAITPLRTCLPNLVNFGPQTTKNKSPVSTHSVNFFGRSYRRVDKSRDAGRRAAAAASQRPMTVTGSSVLCSLSLCDSDMEARACADCIETVGIDMNKDCERARDIDWRFLNCLFQFNYKLLFFCFTVH